MIRAGGVGVALSALLAFATLAHAEPKQLDREDTALLDWLDGLGLAKVKGKTFVRVFPRGTRLARRILRRGGRRIRFNTGREGFLLAEDKDSFTVSHGLWSVTYSRTGANALLQPSFEKARLEDSLGAHLPRRAMKTILRRGRWGHGRLGWGQLTQQRKNPGKAFEVILFARMMRDLGREADAAALLERARSIMWRSTREQWLRDVKSGLGDILLWETVDACANPEVPWPTLHQRFQRIAKGFPNSFCQKDAAILADGIKPMIDSSSDGLGRSSGTPLGVRLIGLHKGKSLPALVRGLRDVTAAGLPTPPSHGVNRRWRGRVVFRGGIVAAGQSSDATELVKRGLEVVPTVLELLGDKRLTRARPIHLRRNARSPRAYLLTHGELALKILSSISGRVFSHPREARAWWSQVEAHGEVEALARMAEEGFHDSAGLLTRLTRRDPRRAARAALKIAQKPNRHFTILPIMRTLPGPEIDQFLLKTVRATRHPLHVRLQAARTMAARKQRLWEAPLVHHLEMVGERTWNSREEQALNLLLQQGDPAILDRLGAIYTKLNTQQRVRMLQTVGNGLVYNAGARADAYESILVAALDDEKIVPYTSTRGYRAGRVQLFLPVMGEVAAAFLAQRRGDRSTSFGRDQRLEMKRAWLGARGQATPGVRAEPYPTPDPKVVARVERALMNANEAQDVPRALEAYRALGLAGVGPLKRALDDELPLSPAAKGMIRSWLRLLAARVRTVRIVDPYRLLKASVKRKLLALRNQRLSARLVVHALRDQVAAHTGRARMQLVLRIHRDAQGRGVQITVSASRRGYSRRGYVSGQWVSRVGRTTRRSGLSHPFYAARRPYAWHGFERAADQVLLARFGVDSEIRALLSWR